MNAVLGCDQAFVRIFVRGWTSIAVEVRCGSANNDGRINQCEACALRLKAAAAP
jgi:hypothetical protein